MRGLRGADGSGSPALPLTLIGLSFAAFTLLSWARPNATQPDLGPRGWAPGHLVPLTLDSAGVTALMWGGYLAGALGLALLWRARGGIRVPSSVPVALAAVALLGAPIGSGDHLNYAAYGRIAAQGGNPYTQSPIDWRGGTDPVAGAVEAPWTTEPSVYGPFATLVQAAISLLGGDSLRLTVWWWQVVVVASWLAVRWLLRGILPGSLHERVDLLWTLNPLLWPIAVLGAHVDTLATALAVAAVWAMHRRAGPLAAVAGGALTGLAGATKFTYAIVGVGLLVAFGWRASRMLRVGGGLLAGFLAVVVPLHVWSGAHTYDQLLRSRQAVSLATPWRLVLETLRGPLGSSSARTLISVGAALLALGLFAAFLRISRPVVAGAAADARGAAGVSRAAGPSPGAGLNPETEPSPAVWPRPGAGLNLAVEPSHVVVAHAAAEPSPAVVALWITCGASLAYSFAAPYTLPWYDLLAWACLPAAAGGALVWLAGSRLLLMGIAYVPGRVLGMSPAVETVTLGFRRAVAPWLALGLWAMWLRLAWRAGSGRRGAARR